MSGVPNLQFGRSAWFPGFGNIAKLQVWHSGATDRFFKFTEGLTGKVHINEPCGPGPSTLFP
ncbi:Uncharacterized protein dnm_063570 [Desulfonema magnum]|uniref:Uncharacterized protein n=1 Tax=Desulfonema magnum TaxID=45655 RepID=A0A975GQQ9_9BACT|nr:Uncharacterized protein dnm_063570 [Desulfonema magnum]